MPELPEVEVVRRGLEPFVRGTTFGAVNILHPRAARGNELPLEAVLPGRTITGVSRRGKFMWLDLAPDRGVDKHADRLYIHLGMSGQLRIGEVTSRHIRAQAELIPHPATAGAAGTVPVAEALTDVTSADVTLAEPQSPEMLSFVDQRTFGYWKLAGAEHIAHIATDPLEEAFDAVATSRRIRAKKAPIKAVLLDQTVVSGIGNIYADEALWAAGIVPSRPASRLRHRDVLRLLDAARQVMAQALKQGGTSFDALYVNVNGESGYFSRSLHVYGRAGQDCDRCGAEILRTVIRGRSSHYCANCQVI